MPLTSEPGSPCAAAPSSLAASNPHTQTFSSTISPPGPGIGVTSTSPGPANSAFTLPPKRAPSATNETHELHDTYTTSLQLQAQQAQAYYARAHDLSRHSSSSGSVPHSLRRTPKFDEGRVRARAASVDSVQQQPAVRFAEDPAPTSEEAEPGQRSSRRRSASASRASPRDYTPHPAVRVSRRTAVAILYALEEAIRDPYQFTPDLLEENASMSDLLGGSGGNGRTSNVGSRSAPTSSVPVTDARTGASATGIRTPRDIWNDRQAREARRRAEADARAEEERQAQADVRAREEERRRRSAEERALAAGVGAQSRVPAAQRPAGAAAGAGAAAASSSSSRPVVPTESAPQAPISGGQSSLPQASTRLPEPGSSYGRPRASSQSQQTSRPAQASHHASASVPTTAGAQRMPASQSHQQRQPTAPAAATSSQTRPGAASAAVPPPQPTSNTAAPVDPSQPRQSSFPHAFERWETLSSHWEGLTSYWIRRLEQYMDENRPEPLIQQMSRQITDLSAAGANLFHAVVELQRLRASSERKFQRWFFETRQEQERFQEVRMELSRQIDTERQAREEAERHTAQAEREKKNSERLLGEMRRELQISKDEARRAWEELGRREQEERDRTLSLRDGQPTLVGGVQVVPMPAMVSRHGSTTQRPSTRGRDDDIENEEYQYEGGQSPTDTDPFTERRGGTILRHEPDVPALSRGTHSGAPSIPATTRPNIPTTDPAPSPLRPHYPTASSAAVSGPAPARTAAATSEPPPEHFYTHSGAYLHGHDVPTSEPPQVSEVGSYVPSVEASTEASDDEEEWQIDAHGNYVRDAHGQPVPYRRRRHSEDSEGGDSYDVRADLERERELARAYGVGQAVSGNTSSSAAYGQVYAPAPPDYSGTGYGEGWNMPRHYHPSRLSDVLEEDERSRTSPSRMSERSRHL